MVEDVLDWGDVVYFNAQCPHGVEPIDPDLPMDWLSFAGRWSVIFAVNKLAGNAALLIVHYSASPRSCRLLSPLP